MFCRAVRRATSTAARHLFIRWSRLVGTGRGKPSVGKGVTCVSVMPLITHTGHGCLFLSRDLVSRPEGGCEGRRPILHFVALYLSASLLLPIHQPSPLFFLFFVHRYHFCFFFILCYFLTPYFNDFLLCFLLVLAVDYRCL